MADRPLPEIKNISDGNIWSLVEFFNQHSQALYRIALAIVKNPDDAEDIVADVFLKISVTAERIDRDIRLLEIILNFVNKLLG